MSNPLLLLLGGCLLGPGDYFEYPANNDQWHPEGIAQAFTDKGIDSTTGNDVDSEWDGSGLLDGYTEWVLTQEQQTTYSLSATNLWQAYGVRLFSVTLDEREIRTTRHCEEDHSPDEDVIVSDPPHDPSEPEECEDNIGPNEYEYEILGSMRFGYELEDQECSVSITRSAPLDYSEASTWRFREYPDDPDWSDVNTCEDLMNDEDTVGALDEIVFGMNTLIEPAFVSHLADYGVARPAFVERLWRGKEEK